MQITATNARTGIPDVANFRDEPHDATKLANNQGSFKPTLPAVKVVSLSLENIRKLLTEKLRSNAQTLIDAH